jgi:hypothetical protein
MNEFMRYLIPLIFTACLAQASTVTDPSLKVLLNGSNASISWNAALSGSADLQHSADLLSWTTIDANNNTGSFFYTVGNATRGFYKLRVPGIFAQAPGLAGFSDTGTSINDGVTYDRTPTLVGRVLGAVSRVRISMNGQPGAVVAVVGGIWTYAVTAEAPLTAGIHTFTVTPVDESEFAGDLSSPLLVSIISTPPAAPTLGIENLSDSGVKGDGLTTEAEPFFSGTTTPGVQVKINIDGVPVGIAQSDANTGAWSFKSPRLADGFHEVSAVSTDLAGLDSAPQGLTVEIFGSRMVMLDASSGGTVELTAAHLLGRNSQGFIVTQVLSGTLEKWDSASNAWVLIPPEALGTTLDNAPSIRTVLFTDIVRWTPSPGTVGTNFVFAVSPVDTAGGSTAPTPQAGTVPGKVVDAVIGGYTQSLGTTISWKDPVDGGGQSTRYSVEVTCEDGKTLLYNVPRTVHGVASVEGGAVIRSRIWAATETGAGESRSYDGIERAESLSRLDYTVTSAVSFMDLGTKARAQLANSPTPTQFTTSLPLGGSHSDLAYLEMQAVPDATEAEQGLQAGTPLIISSETNKLTPKQLADLKANPIYSSYLFPGTENGEVKPDQLRAHFQAGEALMFAGNVDASVRAGATIVVEKAQNLGDGSLGPWFQEARIPIGADGSFSHKYFVPYGLNSVRTRLEYPTTPAAASVGATSSTTTPISTPIDLSNYFNAFGITTQPWQVGNNQGFDGLGNYYDSDYNVDTAGTQNSPVPGTPIIYNGISFPIGPVPTNANQVGGTEGVQNFVRATGQTITVSADVAAAPTIKRMPVTVATTEPLSFIITSPPTPWNGLQYEGYPINIDGVNLVEGDRLLVKNERVQSNNGIWIVSTGVWSRAQDSLTSVQQFNTSMLVKSGTENGGKWFWESLPLEDIYPDDSVAYVEIADPATFPSYLYLAGAASNGNQLSQDITLNFTDGTTEKWTQSFHDWGSDGPPQSPVYGTSAWETVTPGTNQLKPVKVATTGPLSGLLPTAGLTTPSGLQTVDGVALVAGDRVLVKDQTNQFTNGVYIAAAVGNISGTPTIISLGSGYTVAPTVTFGAAPAGGVTATGVAVLGTGSLTGQVTRIIIKNAGSGYVTTPTITIGAAPAGGTNASATLNSNGVGGAGYVSSGEWARALDADTFAELDFASMSVTSGTTNAGKWFWENTNDSNPNGDPTFVFVEVPAEVPTPRPFAGELNLKTEPERINQLGDLVVTPAHIFAYVRNLHGKQLASITLPNNSNIGILSAVVSKAPVVALDQGFASLVLGTTHLTGVDVMALTIVNESNIGAGGGPLTFSFADQPVKGSTTTPPTYATKEVVVPMGQQTTIAYVAPDSSSIMGYTVQKADGTCVGSDCSTYLINWSNGAGNNNNWASNITPSLSSQMKPGQHWTMTIQNAGLGYNGFLSSPSGQGLPEANGSTPAGAQFKLETQNEITYQPPWAVVTETIVGEVIAIVVLTVATGGAADAPLLTITADALVEESVAGTVTVTAQVADVLDVTIEDVGTDEQSVELLNLGDEYEPEVSGGIYEEGSFNSPAENAKILRDARFEFAAYGW